MFAMGSYIGLKIIKVIEFLFISIVCRALAEGSSAFLTEIIPLQVVDVVVIIVVNFSHIRVLQNH